MSEAIRVEHLNKVFHLYSTGYGSLKGMLLWWKRGKRERVQALDDVSFSLDAGECVGIVGRNGAGKSTLLSILARVYKPTSGEMQIKGRLAPLLELGAGFHPDLTGLENVFFNGVILGLTRAEVAERMPSIVDFAEIGDYVGAPVRTYSSGMLLRLGFSVAVHVDASILLVDEALSVGDLEFQKKCLRRIEEFRAGGGAILFVSHDLETVRRTANRTIWMQKGRIVMEGATDAVVDAYESGSPIETV